MRVFPTAECRTSFSIISRSAPSTEAEANPLVFVVDAVRRWQQARAGGNGQVGGIHVRYRFGGSLKLHIHRHMLLMDGVYRKDDGGTLCIHADSATVQR